MQMRNEKAVWSGLLLSFILWMPSCSGPRLAQIMTYEEYHQLSVRPPYVIELRGKKGSLLYFGAAHSVDPNHSQVAQMIHRWDEFRPTVAYSEGGISPLKETVEEAVRNEGETGLLRYFAERDKVPIRSLEPTDSSEVEMLLSHFTAEQVKLHYLLRQVMQFRREGRVEPLEAYLGRYLTEFNAIVALDVPPYTVTEIKECVRRVLPLLEDWTRVPETWFYPTRSEAFTNEIARRLNRFRDEHMVELLTHAVMNGERVYAVVGHSHVVMQEPALRTILDQPRLERKNQ